MAWCTDAGAYILFDSSDTVTSSNFVWEVIQDGEEKSKPQHRAHLVDWGNAHLLPGSYRRSRAPKPIDIPANIKIYAPKKSPSPEMASVGSSNESSLNPKKVGTARQPTTTGDPHRSSRLQTKRPRMMPPRT